MKSRKGALQFMSGFIFIVLAIPTLINGLKGIFTGYNTWVVGISFIVLGLANILESGFWKLKNSP